MAAPASKTVRDMTGVWQMNRKLTGDTNPLFVLQGISWILRKVINFATVNISMKQGTLSAEGSEDDKSNSTPIPTIHVTQVVTPGSISSEHTYVLDSVPRETTNPVFGKLEVASKFITAAEIEDTEVRAKFESVKEEQTLMVENARSVAGGWETVSVWGFEEIEGERRYVRYTVTNKGEKEVRLRLVYDFVREL